MANCIVITHRDSRGGEICTRHIKDADPQQALIRYLQHRRRGALVFERDSISVAPCHVNHNPDWRCDF